MLLGLITLQPPPEAAKTDPQKSAPPSTDATSRTTAPPGAAPSLFPEGYLDHEALTRALRQLVERSGGKARLDSLARSREGRDVWLVSLGLPEKPPAVPDSRPATPPEPRKPAILVVANLEGDHLVGSQVALGILDQVQRDPSWQKRLEQFTLYVVPRLNPDGAERLLRTPRADVRTNLEPVDRDRDGRSGEDGPDDLNGDGLIGQMRIKDAKATLIPDPSDPRLLRKADPVKGERAVYSEYAEGFDNDGDGLINEDPPGGVNLNRNWPYRWSEYDPEAGFSPVGEPETRALIQFAFDHPEIAVVWSFGLNDNLATEPKKPEASFDAADLPLFVELSRLYGKARKSPEKRPGPGSPPSAPPAAGPRERTKGQEPAQEKGKPPGTPPEPKDRKPDPDPSPPAGQTPAAATSVTAPASPGATTDGSLSEWAYHHYGAVGLASRLWEGPELTRPAAAGSGTAPPTGSPPSPNADAPKGGPTVPDEGRARWLYWNDHVMKGRAFLPFAPLDHPRLGKVEIGGWKPGVRLNPPIEQVEDIARVHRAFLGELAGRLPRLAIRDVKVEARGSGIYQVTAAVVNEGVFPTALVRGTRSRKAPPVRVRLDVGSGRLLAGPPRSQFDSLGGSGGRREFRWLVMALDADDAGAKPYAVTLSASTPKAGAAVQTIPIGAAR
ncbi:MAG: M14 family metallopeptidase [Isosphaeraceae bacterium]